MSLNATDVSAIYEQGVKDGQHAIQNGVSIDDHLEYFRMKKSGKPRTASNFKEYVEMKKSAKKPDDGFLHE